jgi:hypothetical protein
MSKIALSPNAGGTGVFTIASPNSNSDRTLNLPDNSGTVLTTGSTFAGTGPAFSVYQASATTSLSANTWVKLTFDTEEFDTNNNFASSRFTPTVAGYYQVTANAGMASTSASLNIKFYKNGVANKGGSYPTGANWVQATALIYCNGTTDYIEAYCLSGASQNTFAGIDVTWFAGAMVRAA